MNKIAKKAGYFIDVIGSKQYNKIYINIGEQLSPINREKNIVLSINNGMVKLEVDNETVKILDSTTVLSFAECPDWDYLNLVASIFVDKIKKVVEVDESFIYYLDDAKKVDYNDAGFPYEIDF